MAATGEGLAGDAAAFLGLPPSSGDRRARARVIKGMTVVSRRPWYERRPTTPDRSRRPRTTCAAAPRIQSDEQALFQLSMTGVSRSQLGIETAATSKATIAPHAGGICRGSDARRSPAPADAW